MDDNNEMTLAEKMQRAYVDAVHKAQNILEGNYETPALNTPRVQQGGVPIGNRSRNFRRLLLDPQEIQAIQAGLYSGGVQQWFDSNVER